MIQTNSMLQPMSADDNRRRALAKVYALLIRLAEEAEKKSMIADNQTTAETTELVSQEDFKKEI